MQKVVITTARPLSAVMLKTVKDKLEKYYEAELKYEVVTDPAVIGGIKILVGTQETDATVLRKLETIKMKLLQ